MVLLLLCDIGNTAIKFGISCGNGLEASCSPVACADASVDSLSLAIIDILEQSGHEASKFDACVAVSVVPGYEPVLKKAVQEVLNLPVLFAQRELPVPLKNYYRHPAQLGADRIIGVFAAIRIMEEMASVIVIDYGTALTFDCGEGNAYLGGLIFPGPGIARNALCASAAGLSFIDDLDNTETAFMRGLDTGTCMRQGLLHGYASVTEGLIRRLRCGLKEPVGIVATGGYADLISAVVSENMRVVPGLIMLGLEQLYMEKTAQKSQEEKK